VDGLLSSLDDLFSNLLNLMPSIDSNMFDSLDSFLGSFFDGVSKVTNKSQLWKDWSK